MRAHHRRGVFILVHLFGPVSAVQTITSGMYHFSAVVVVVFAASRSYVGEKRTTRRLGLFQIRLAPRSIVPALFSPLVLGCCTNDHDILGRACRRLVVLGGRHSLAGGFDGGRRFTSQKAGRIVFRRCVGG